VRQLEHRAREVAYRNDEVDVPRELLSGAVDVTAGRERRGETAMRGEVEWIDRDGGPEEREGGDTVARRAEHRCAVLQRVEIAAARAELSHRSQLLLLVHPRKCLPALPHALPPRGGRYLPLARSLQRRGVDRRDVRQVLRDPLPGLALVTARVDVAVRGAEVQADVVELVVVHALAERLERRALREALVVARPRRAFARRLVHGAPVLGCALGVVQRDTPCGLGIAWVDRSGEAEVRR